MTCRVNKSLLSSSFLSNKFVFFSFLSFFWSVDSRSQPYKKIAPEEKYLNILSVNSFGYDKFLINLTVSLSLVVFHTYLMYPLLVTYLSDEHVFYKFKDP
jgi:hypothetical protein